MTTAAPLPSVDTPIALGDVVSMPRTAVTETFAILGNRGAGKSTAATRFAEQLHLAGLPVVVLDIKGDWWGIRSSADGTRDGLPFVIFGGDHADLELHEDTGALIADAILDQHLSCVIDLSHLSKTKARRFATAFAERLYRKCRQSLHVIVDEADVLIPQRADATTAELLGAMEDIAKRGRQRGLGLTLASQRGQEVNKSVLDLVETVVLLRMTGARTIKAVKEWISVQADEDTDADAADVIRSLPKLAMGEAWVWSPSFLGMLRRTRIALFETFDSHATPEPGQAPAVPQSRAEIDLTRLRGDIAALAAVHANRSGGVASKPTGTGSRARLGEIEHENHAQRDTIAQMTETIAQLRNELRTAQARADELESAAKAIRRTLDSVGTGHRGGQNHLPKSETPKIEPDPSGRAGEARRSRTTQEPNAETSLADSPDPSSDPVELNQFRAGAQRMLRSLGGMAPLRLTRPQWAMVSRLKAKSGTFTTYIGDLRRAGLVHQDSDGCFTLTEAGFDTIGGRPAPMDAHELQTHYLSILRSGAARMLSTVIEVHPDSISKYDLAEAVALYPTSGTFTTYLGELRRNTLVTIDGQNVRATDMLIHGPTTA